MRRRRRHSPLGALAGFLVVIGMSGPGCKSKRGGQAQPSRPGDDAGNPPTPATPDRSNERVILADLSVRTVDPEHRREIGAQALADGLRLQLLASDHFYAQPNLSPPLVGRRADVVLSINYDTIAEKGEVSLLAAVEIEVAWKAGDDLAPVVRVLAEHVVKPPARDSDLDRAIAEHVAAAVVQAGQELIAKESLRTSGVDTIVAALDPAGDGPSTDTALWALSLIRERKLAAGYDAAITMLDGSDRDLRETAVGALIAIGDQRAVAVLAHKVEMSDYEFLRVVIEAASALGGEEAVSFLEFVASGHPDADIRERAARGLERITKQSP